MKALFNFIIGMNCFTMQGGLTIKNVHKDLYIREYKYINFKKRTNVQLIKILAM